MQDVDLVSYDCKFHLSETPNVVGNCTIELFDVTYYLLRIVVWQNHLTGQSSIHRQNSTIGNIRKILF